MNNFINAMEQIGKYGNTANYTYTENGALSYKSSLNGLVDLFSNFAQNRNNSENDILALFLKAFNEDRTNALRLLFYIRTPRNGQGEKRFFQIVLKYLANNYPDWVVENLHNIVEFGYWKDLYVLSDTFIWQRVVQFWCNEIVSENLLAAKYAPTETQNKNKTNSKNNHVDIFAKQLFGDASSINKKKYRQLISYMRSVANIVEKLMSTKNWNEINFEQVPSVAHKNYRKAFSKHQAERYAQYLESVKTGEKKINAAALTPVDIVVQYPKYGNIDNTLESMWKALPDYFVDINRTIIPVLDGSGSMYSGYNIKVNPIDVSVALGLYCMQHNKSEAYKNKFISFSSKAKFITVKSTTLKEQIAEVKNEDDVANTNLQTVFDLILEVAKKNKLTQVDLPTDVLIISDMQFDSADHNAKTNYQTAYDKFAKAGYTLPVIWFWNVDSTPTDQPVLANTPNTYLLSGYSPSIVKTVLTNKVTTPYDLMLAVCNREDLQVINW